MKNNKSIYIIAFVGIILIVFIMIASTYAYFTIDIRGSGKNLSASSFNENMEITFNDTSNLTLVNAYTGDTVSKTFNIVNTGNTVVYYNIVFTELVNNFVNTSDLVYTLTSSNGGANKNETIVPNVDNSAIASHIKIGTGETHNYTLTITFLRTEDDQTSNMNKTFSSKIDVVGSTEINSNLNIYADNSLGYTMINGNTPTSADSIDFTASPTNGLYYTNNSINGSTVYFFRGDTSLNNNVLFAGICWKIIRTTEDLGVRLIYNGAPSNGQCANTTGSSTYTSASSYNSNSSYNAYVGFKYGSPNSSSYVSEHANTNKSTIKTTLDTWFLNNLNSYESYIEDSYYCNNRYTTKFNISSVSYSTKGFSNNNTGYDSYYRLNIDTSSTPSYDCKNINDIFTVTNENGNASNNTYPIGLITADEAVYAGYKVGTANTTSYLYNAADYWTMTPAYFSTNAYNYYINSGNIAVQTVNTSSIGIRPVITLKNSTILLSGNGSTTTPYKITN